VRFAIAFFLLLALGASGAAADEVDRARAALARNQPFILIAVSRNFLNPDHMVNPTYGEGETQADWAYYLGQWQDAASPEFPVIIVSFAEYRSLVAEPEHGDQCMTIFIRNRRSVRYYRTYCVPVPYDEGLAWMRGKPISEAAQRELPATSIKLRARRQR
jgi:hypothetical protein